MTLSVASSPRHCRREYRKDREREGRDEQDVCGALGETRPELRVLFRGLQEVRLIDHRRDDGAGDERRRVRALRRVSS